jgi:hypothetical protein
MSVKSPVIAIHQYQVNVNDSAPDRNANRGGAVRPAAGEAGLAAPGGLT